MLLIKQIFKLYRAMALIKVINDEHIYAYLMEFIRISVVQLLNIRITKV